MKRTLIEVSLESAGHSLPISIEFATPHELAALANWKATRRSSAAMADAIEYAALTCKRWSFYLNDGRAITEIGQISERASQGADELAFLVIARARWARPSTVGLCLFRRTWTGNLVVDFLSVHPSFLEGGSKQVKGIGATLLLALTEIAVLLGAQTIWGEATRESAPIYERMFELECINDLFVVETSGYEKFRARYLVRWPDARLLLTKKSASSSP